MMMRKLLVSGLLAGSLLVSGCNTIRGLGRDIQSIPDAVTQAPTPAPEQVPA
jgi:predicted small secreted protein